MTPSVLPLTPSVKRAARFETYAQAHAVSETFGDRFADFIFVTKPGARDWHINTYDKMYGEFIGYVPEAGQCLV